MFIYFQYMALRVYKISGRTKNFNLDLLTFLVPNLGFTSAIIF